MNKRTRPSWDQWALDMATAAMERSEDAYYQVGAFALNHNNSTAASGYNGTAPGVEIDWSDRDQRRDLMIHAEVNCLNYVLPGQCRLIAVTTLPCPSCMALIAAKKIPKVIFEHIYKTDPTAEQRTRRMAEIFNIELLQLQSTKKVSP
ncbi:hypothetical protein EBS80_00120 [bacterium]|nr:hypothetical protein [bacterium]